MTGEGDRRFSDEEVAEILRRAVQPIREETVPARRPNEGITLEQLVSIAAEAGIHPDRVRRSAHALVERSDPDAGTRLLGPPTRYVFDRVVDGALPADRLSEVVAAIRRQIRGSGQVTQVADWVEWRSDVGTIRITVKPEGDRTRLQVIGDAGARLGGIVGPTALLTLMSVVALGDAGGLTVLFGGGIVAGALVLTRGIWEWVGRRAAAKYRRLADGLANDVERITLERARDTSDS